MLFSRCIYIYDLLKWISRPLAYALPLLTFVRTSLWFSGPELNPMEQLFRQIRQRLSHWIFDDLKATHQALFEVRQEYWQHPETLIRLTAYPWWI